MCKTTPEPSNKKQSSPKIPVSSNAEPKMRRRGKRDKQATSVAVATNKSQAVTKRRTKKKSKSLQKHGSDGRSGGVEALLPSLVGVAILVCGAMAKMGFRGRASVAGIDLGTTNSVICVQAPSKSVGEIVCIPDPSSSSPIIPSVVSFLESPEGVGKRESKTDLEPHPSHVVVGREAKLRIDTHPHHTLYNAKRVLGRPHSDDAVHELRNEVEFDIVPHRDNSDDALVRDGVVFRVPQHHAASPISLKPQQVGSYIVHHLMEITKQHLGHENIQSAVIAVPAKFDSVQRMTTVEAFRNAGVTVARILEEPTAAALAYGLHKKENVHYILVYDFGGGTLDVSVLHVSDGFVDVMGSDGDDRLGGADFDAAVAHFLLDQQGDAVHRASGALRHLEKHLEETDGGDPEEMLDAACPSLRDTPLCTVSSLHTIGERMKIELSSHPEGGGVAKAECFSPPDTSSMTLSMDEFCSSLEKYPLSLTSEEYDNAVHHLYERAKLPVQRVLEDLNLDKEEIDEVVMVGGTTRMPQIRELVKEVLGVDTLNTHIDPDVTVAYGAASVID